MHNYNYHLDCPIVEKIEYYTLFNPFYIDIFPNPRQNHLNNRALVRYHLDPTAILRFGSFTSTHQIDRSRRDRQGFPSIRCRQSSGSARRQSYSDLLIKGTFEGGYLEREEAEFREIRAAFRPEQTRSKYRHLEHTRSVAGPTSSSLFL